MSEEKKAWGSRLKQARLAAGYTLRGLGAELGIDASTASTRIGRYESGLQHPDLMTVHRIAALLRVPVSYLYEEDDRLAELVLSYYRLSKSGQAALRHAAATIEEEVPKVRAGRLD
jgi:transcriptional regulator with XRE-family HTH domain